MRPERNLANAGLAALAAWALTLPAAGQTGSSLGVVEESVCPDNAHAVFHACALEAAQTAAPPRTAEGRPDFSGYWLRRAWAFESLEAHPVTLDDFGGPSAVVDPADGLVPMQAWAVEQTRTNAERYLHHNAACILAGPAGTMYMTSRFQFIQDENHLVMVGEQLTTHPYRIIPLDGRPHIGDISMWNGDPRGRWEDDTLVVETRNQNAKYMLDQRGRFITDEAAIVERFTLIEDDTIHYRATFDDPNVYTEPFTIAFAFRRNMPEIWEEACFENNTDSMRVYRAIGYRVFPGITGEQARALKSAWEAAR